MQLELDIQNPFEFKNLPSLNEFQRWADVVLQRSTSENDIGLYNAKDNTGGYSLVIRVTDENESRTLNHTYRQKNAPTNVLSFPFEMPELPEMNQPGHLGDLVFCGPLIEKEASQQGKTLLQHWAHLVIHGMLHLQGYDHINDEDAEIMESLEINMLQQLDFPNPYE